MHIKLVFHKTKEIVKLVREHGGKAELIITMNATGTVLRQIADKRKTILICTTYTEGVEKFVKEMYICPSIHMKIYLTRTHIIVSSANASLSNMDEVSVLLKREGEGGEKVEVSLKREAERLTGKSFL